MNFTAWRDAHATVACKHTNVSAGLPSAHGQKPEPILGRWPQETVYGGFTCAGLPWRLAVPEGDFDAHVGQLVGSFVAGIAVVAPHPAPIDQVAALLDQSVQPLPEFHVLDRRLARRAPSLGFPA